MSGPQLLLPLPPEVADKVVAIIRRAGTRGVGCVHLEQQPTGVVCMQHPRMIRCVECAARHIAGHDEVDEFTCDLCGGHLDGPSRDRWHVSLGHTVELDTTVSIGRGRRAAVGLVRLIGWGACAECMPIADRLGERGRR